MNRVTHITSPEKPWGKSHTPKRYIHPPFAENIVTMWPNTIILIGETQGGAEPQKSRPGRANESVLSSCGLEFLYKNKMLDYKNVTYHNRGDGIPVHAITQNLGKFSLHQESFCSIERVPTAFVRLTIQNNTDAPLCDTVSMIARTAPEFDLIGCVEPDGYLEPEASVYRWMIHPLWEHTRGRITDGSYTVYYQHDDKIGCDYNDYYFVHFNFSLAPREETTIYCAFGRGRVASDFSYEAEKSKTEAFWNGELEKIRDFPKKEDPYFYAMYRSLVAQGLQMFCYPKGVNYVLLRQGGLQRLLWPTDVRSMIRALARIGDFEEYTDAILNTYFNVMQSRNGENRGEIVNFGIPWGSVTGSVLFAFGAVAKYSTKLYEKYRDNAYAAFQWMERQREKTKQDPDMASGLFPPLRAADAPATGQLWGLTDGWNLQGYALYLQGLRAQNDPHLPEVERAFEDYMNCAKAVFDRAVSRQKDNDIIILPIDARGDSETEEPNLESEKVNKEDETLSRNSLADCMLLGLGLGGFDTPVARKVLKGIMDSEYNHYQNGLGHCFAKSDASADGYRWYGSWADAELYFYFMNCGDKKRAKEILDAQLNYIMTNEYYMMERYDDHDPHYTPWCPNCSANGRTISMLCDWYIDREEKE